MDAVLNDKVLSIADFDKFMLESRIQDTTNHYYCPLVANLYTKDEYGDMDEYPEEYGRFRLKCSDDIERNNGVFDVEYQGGKATVTFSPDGEYDIALTAAAASKLMLAGEGHNSRSAMFIDGVEINGNADDFFRAFPYRITKFDDSRWSI